MLMISLYFSFSLFILNKNMTLNVRIIIKSSYKKMKLLIDYIEKLWQIIV